MWLDNRMERGIPRSSANKSTGPGIRVSCRLDRKVYRLPLRWQDLQSHFKDVGSKWKASEEQNTQRPCGCAPSVYSIPVWNWNGFIWYSW
jgi:hypothetical protein